MKVLKMVIAGFFIWWLGSAIYAGMQIYFNYQLHMWGQ